jgi:hypothetical protein
MSLYALRLRRARLYRAVALIVAATLALDACTYWVPSARSIGEIRTQGHPDFPDYVRITTSDSTVHILHDARIMGDSLFGVPFGNPATPTTAFALDDIRKYEVNRVAVLPTVLVVWVVLGTIANSTFLTR